MTVFVRAARALLIPVQDLKRLCRSAPYRYKVYSVPKRRGTDRRTVAQPSPVVKQIQRWLVQSELKDLPVHESAMGYRVGVGISANAEIHRSNNYLAKFDFEDFFPSISAEDISAHIRSFAPLDYSEEEVEFISRFACWYDRKRSGLRLCVGAPSSPFLSNTVLYDFDCRVRSWCDERGVRYSRYADDLTFSSVLPGVLSDTYAEVTRVLHGLSYPRLRINEAKTVHTSRKRLRMVTGVVLTPDCKLSIGRDRKRLIRAMLHRFVEGELAIGEIERLRGLLAFAIDVEPEFVAAMERKYSVGALRQIRSYSPNDDNL